MNEIEILERQKLIFKKLFLLSNRLQTAGDKVLSEEMTVIQWLLTVVVAQFKDSPPTLGEVAQLMGSSRQNVKQIAMKLEKSNYLVIENDEQDARIIRIKLTEKSFLFWQKRHEKIMSFLTEIFRDLSEYEIQILYDCLNKLNNNILKIENTY